MSNNFKDLLANSNSWPVQEAKKILESINYQTPTKGYVLFETGYGPSGLPHIGTFGEVARTSMVINCFRQLSDIPAKLFCFSDDLDGLRKVPDNLPNREMIEKNLHKPLTSIPDPYETHKSFGENMNSRLCQFLDRFDFEYELHSATEHYKSGHFDKLLLAILKHYDEIMSVMLPTLGEERRQTYSPFLPISSKTGKVLQVPMEKINPEKGTITYYNEDNELVETTVTGGNCKLQWKVDWAMRWCALDVNYEMHGKDLIPSAEISDKICKILGYKSPHRYVYELFMDENGKKISKSKGNGIAVNDWLNYAPQESLSYYMYQNPRKSRRLYFDVIPKSMDEYLTYLHKFYEQEDEKKVNNPLLFIHNFQPPKDDLVNVNFSLLLNLASVCNPEDSSILWGFIKKYNPEFSKDNSPMVASMVDYAVKYYNDFIKPYKKYKTPDETDRQMLVTFIDKLQALPTESKSEDIQAALYDLCRENEFESKKLFMSLYKLLLGQEQGPRWGSFIALYGIDNIIKFANEVLNA